MRRQIFLWIATRNSFSFYAWWPHNYCCNSNNTVTSATQWAVVQTCLSGYGLATLTPPQIQSSATSISISSWNDCHILSKKLFLGFIWPRLSCLQYSERLTRWIDLSCIHTLYAVCCYLFSNRRSYLSFFFLCFRAVSNENNEKRNVAILFYFWWPVTGTFYFFIYALCVVINTIVHALSSYK